MIIFYEEGITYFVYADRRDIIVDFSSFCTETYVCKNETSAIRRHLLLQAGITEEE